METLWIEVAVKKKVPPHVYQRPPIVAAKAIVLPSQRSAASVTEFDERLMDQWSIIITMKSMPEQQNITGYFYYYYCYLYYQNNVYQ